MIKISSFLLINLRVENKAHILMKEMFNQWIPEINIVAHLLTLNYR